MKRKKGFDPDMLVEDVMVQWPESVRVFIRHRMQCVGCELAPFHTLEYAAQEHGIDEDPFYRDLAELMDEELAGN